MDSAIRELTSVLPEFAVSLTALAPGGAPPVDPLAVEIPKKDRKTAAAANNASKIALPPTSAAGAVLPASTSPNPGTSPSTTTCDKPSKLEQKPGPNKAKFSSITGPEIIYDGASQKAFFDAWTGLNSKRGVLRREMMALKRKKVLTLPRGGDYDYSDSEDESEEQNSDKDAVRETEEEKAAREEAERKKQEAEQRREAREKKTTDLLEFVDACLDRAARGCENSAFAWLKGEREPGHVSWINARIMEAVERIRAETEVPREVEVDEGFEEEEDDDEDDDLPHKMPDLRKMGFRRAGERM